MTTTPLYPQSAPAETGALNPAQRWALLVLVSSHLDTLAHHLFQGDMNIALDSTQTVAELERLDLLKRHGPNGEAQPFVTLNREAFMAAFDLYAADIVAQGGEGCL